ncbi:sugar ABC transporter permease [Tessaracoccus sp. OS52]|uniref:carbohydrate ABC transporter permease n=1 Tax=Tessaracoccus sp. OS52 TaxID=2886691 RepID=UPI001D0FFF70|nr:sugar ABC transporter permease [Tessaracoccus sp. OS52]
MTTAESAPALAAPSPRRRGRGATTARRQARWGWGLAAPASLHILLWTGLPVIVSIILSLTSYRITRRDTPVEFLGLGNFSTLMADSEFWTALWHNLVLAVVGVPVAMAIALVLAVMLNQGIRGEGVFRTLVFLPHVTATVAIAMVWLWIYQPNGLANTLLSFFGIPSQGWLNSMDQALGSVLLVTIWQGIGLKMMIYLAALQSVDVQLFEAAKIDGASSVQTFFAITLPMLKPATFFVLVTSLIGNFQTFDLIYNMTLGGPGNATTVITWLIFDVGIQRGYLGLASAMSVVLLLILIVLTALARKVTGSDD